MRSPWEDSDSVVVEITRANAGAIATHEWVRLGVENGSDGLPVWSAVGPSPASFEEDDSLSPLVRFPGPGRHEVQLHCNDTLIARHSIDVADPSLEILVDGDPSVAENESLELHAWIDGALGERSFDYRWNVVGAAAELRDSGEPNGQRRLLIPNRVGFAVVSVTAILMDSDPGPIPTRQWTTTAVRSISVHEAGEDGLPVTERAYWEKQIKDDLRAATNDLRKSAKHWRDLLAALLGVAALVSLFETPTKLTELSGWAKGIAVGATVLALILGAFAVWVLGRAEDKAPGLERGKTPEAYKREHYETIKSLRTDVGNGRRLALLAGGVFLLGSTLVGVLAATETGDAEPDSVSNGVLILRDGSWECISMADLLEEVSFTAIAIIESCDVEFVNILTR